MLYQLSYLATSVAGIDVRQVLHYTIADWRVRSGQWPVDCRLLGELGVRTSNTMAANAGEP
jgi:hypothetical protein